MPWQYILWLYCCRASRTSFLFLLLLFLVLVLCWCLVFSFVTAGMFRTLHFGVAVSSRVR